MDKQMLAQRTARAEERVKSAVGAVVSRFHLNDALIAGFAKTPNRSADLERMTTLENVASLLEALLGQVVGVESTANPAEALLGQGAGVETLPTKATKAK